MLLITGHDLLLHGAQTLYTPPHCFCRVQRDNQCIGRLMAPIFLKRKPVLALISWRPARVSATRTRTRESGVLPASTVSKRTSTVRTSAWDPAKNLRLAVPKRRNYLRTSGSASGVAVLNTRARLYGAARGVHARLCRIVPLYRPCSALCTLRLRRCLGSPKSCSGRSVIAWTTLQKLWTRSSAQPSCGAIGRSWSLSHHRRVHVHASPEVARR